MKNEDIKAIIRWLETEGCINYMDGVYQISDGEFEEYYKENKKEYILMENKSEYMSEDEFAVFICRNALEEAGVEEEIIDLCVDWDNQESTDKALEYFKNLERGKIYKIYAQCARNPHPITEITEQQADTEILLNAIDEYIDTQISPSLYDELVSEDNFDTDSEILYNTISNLIFNFWEVNHVLYCGDYEILKNVEDPCSLSRPNICGFWNFTDEEIKKEFNRVKEHRESEN